MTSRIAFKLKSIFIFTLWVSTAFAGEISTNATSFSNSPPWLTEGRVNHVIEGIQQSLEWDIRKVKVIWYDKQETFQNFHHFDSTVLAVSQKSDNSIHLGPRITSSNFDSVFGHELVHIILFQKFKNSVPTWLDEGLANYVSKRGKVDYAWLASQPFSDVTRLAHPFQSGSNPRYRYQASTALIEMIASKCSLNDLLQLSLEKKLETYLATLCQISDINRDFKIWVKKRNTMS